MHEHRVFLRACGTLWSAREMASVTLSAERERRTENVFYMLLSIWSKLDARIFVSIFEENRIDTPRGDRVETS